MSSMEVLARRGRSLLQAARVASVSLGDPPPERSALAEFLRRPSPKPPSVRISESKAISPEDAAAARRRADDCARKARKRAEAKAAAAAAEAERAAAEAEGRRTHERERKQKWRDARRAAGLPTQRPRVRTEAQLARQRDWARARRARRKAVAEAWHQGEANIAVGFSRPQAFNLATKLVKPLNLFFQVAQLCCALLSPTIGPASTARASALASRSDRRLIMFDYALDYEPLRRREK